MMRNILVFKKIWIFLIVLLSLLVGAGNVFGKNEYPTSLSSITVGSTYCVGSTVTLNLDATSSQTCSSGNTSATVTVRFYSNSMQSNSGGTLVYTAPNYLAESSTVTSTYSFTALSTLYYYAVVSYTVTGCNAAGSLTTTTGQMALVTVPVTSPDDQSLAGMNLWIGHVYDGLDFNTYFGTFTESEAFDQSFGGNQNCFSINSSLGSRQIYTETFSVRYRMNSTKKGLYVVDLGSDDGSRLNVNGTLVYNNWVDQGFTSRPRVLMNLNGASSLVYDFFENGGENRVVFQNLTLVLINDLNTNTTQNICLGSAGAAISGDVYGTLPTGITLSGTGYQWAYSTTSSTGSWTDISGATAATYTPSAVAPFNTVGTYYFIRKAILSSANNVSPNPYLATNESNAATITVSALPTAPTSGSNTYTYDGTPKTASATVGANETVDWYAAISGGTTISAPSGTNVGTYIAYAETRNTITGCVSDTRTLVTLTINKAVLTITAGNQTVAFGTPVATVTGAGSYTPTGFVNSETATVIGGIATYTTTYTEATATGTAGVTITPVVTGLTATNYSFNPANGTITISQASSTITATGTATFTYTGLAQGPTTSTVTGSTGAVTFSYLGTGSTTYGPSATLPTNAGTYEVVATVAADGNFNAATSAALAFTINEAALTITANNQSKCFGTVFSFTGTEFTSVGLINSDEVASVTLTSSGSGDVAVAGSYNIVPSAANGTGLDNYEITYSNDGLLTVNDLPTGTLSSNGSICSGASTSLTFNKNSGVGPFDLVINGISYTDIASGGTINISPTDLSTTYTLTSITDKGVSPNCSNVVNASTSVSVYPIEVNASVGLAQACYNTVKEAFDKINDGTHKGAITVKVHASTTETASAVLNASGSGGSSYTSVLLYPTATGLSISGNLNAPLIDLNGADNVTIDGRVNATGSAKDLIISNSSATAAASTIRFRTDASGNNVKYCIIQGSSTAVAVGTIIFLGGTATGNDGNTITNNTITSAGLNLPVNAIYSAGTSAIIDNSNNTISNNNIQDFFSSTLASNGVFVSTFNSGWTISDNRIFQTALRNSTGTSIVHRAIQITSGNGHAVTNNIIGFASENDTGIMTYTGSGTTTPLFRAIELSVGTTSASSIQGNTISAISFSTTSGSATAPGIFTGISVLVGSVNIGTDTGNTIGATTGNSSILVTSTVSLGYMAGIYATSTGTVNIQNNKIGSISTGSTALIGHTFHGINTAGVAGNFNISENTIGSTTTPNSIAIGTSGVTTTPVCTFNGITNAATGTISITDNTIQNVTAFGIGASVFNGLLNSAGSGTLTMTGNSIIAINNTGTGTVRGVSNTAATASTANINSNTIRSSTLTGTGAFIGILNSSTAATTNINSNNIRNISRTTATGTVTGISSTGAIATALNINNNLLGNSDGGFVTYDAATLAAATLVGINVTSATGASALSIQNNDISGIVHSLTGASPHTYIINAAPTLSQNISNNTFTNLDVNTTGNIIFISNSVAMPVNGTQTVSGNSIVTGFRKSSAGGTVTLFTSTAATLASGVTVTHQNNNLSNITVAGTTIIAGWIHNDAGISTKIFTGNIFNNWNSGSGAITQGMSINGGASGSSITDNTISNFTTTGAITGLKSGISGTYNITGNNINNFSGGGVVIGYSIPAAASTITFDNNIIQTLSTTAGGTNTISGIWAVGSSSLTVSNNTINDIQSTGVLTTTGSVRGIVNSGAGSITINTNTITNIKGNSATTGSVSGILLSAGTTVNAYQNTISGLSGNALTTGSVNGISITGGSSISASKNKVYDLSSSSSSLTGTVNGIAVSGSTASLNVTIVNNTVGDLKVTAGSGADLIRGISVINTGATSNVNLYYNTIYLNASSTGTNFGTSGVYHTANSTAKTAALDLRNNIIVNNSTPKGTGLTVAFRRSAATLGNYSESSNNNLFYSGTPDASRLIYRSTISYQTLSDFQSLVSPRETLSVTEDMIANQAFLSITGADVTFLHIDPTKTTLAESGAADIVEITDDFDGEKRYRHPEYSGNGSAPDIGADEFEGICVLTITSATADASPICAGTTTTLTANGVSGTVPVVTWWSAPEGTGTNYGIGLTLVAGSGTYYARITGNCGNPVEESVTVEGNPMPIPTFTSQPGSSACVGIDVTYTTEASMSGYMWEFPGIPNTDYSITSGGTGTSNAVTLKWLTEGSKTATINYTDGNGCTAASATSSTPTTVNPTSTGGTATAASAQVCKNTSTTLTLTGSVGTIQWQTNASGSWDDISRANGVTYNTPVLTTATSYRAVVKSGICSSETSNEVTVGIDTEKPTIINCPANISVPVTDGLCSAVVSWTEPTATDNCTLTSFVSNLSPGATIAVGTSTVTYTATDNSGNVETCSFTITVTDNITPAITCPSGATVFCVANAPSYNTYAEFTGALGSASDNCSLNESSFAKLANHLSVDGLTLTRTYRIADMAGNTSTCTQVFTISQPAVIITSLGLNNTCIGGVLDITSNSTGLNYQWQVSTDNGGLWTTTGTNSASYNGTLAHQGDQFRLRVSETTDFNVGCVATSNTLTFRENIPPVFTALKPTDMTVCIPNGATTVAIFDISLDNSKVTDVCTAFADLSIAYTISGTTTLSGNTNLADGTVFNLGISTVEYTVTDLSGNSETHSFTVTVSEAPSLSDISTDGAAATDGSGYKPYQSSSHTYTVDGGIATSGYSYTWTVLDNANSVLSPGSANTYTINATNTAAVVISWGASIPLTANNYKIRVRKTSNTNTCFIEKELSVTVLINNFNVKVEDSGDDCQSGEMGTTNIWWNLTQTGGSSNWHYKYEIVEDIGGVLTTVVPLTNILYSTVTPLTIYYPANNTVGVQKTYTIFISSVFDEFGTPETNLSDNQDSLILFGVPNTSEISTD
ncbi:MAG: HYR domain-containing protein [Bacteroidota bacterium]|nr:HYR domain-containing protein [Bacteroidota bacterium]